MILFQKKKKKKRQLIISLHTFSIKASSAGSLALYPAGKGLNVLNMHFDCSSHQPQPSHCYKKKSQKLIEFHLNLGFCLFPCGAIHQ